MTLGRTRNIESHPSAPASSPVPWRHRRGRRRRRAGRFRMRRPARLSVMMGARSTGGNGVRAQDAAAMVCMAHWWGVRVMREGRDYGGGVAGREQFLLGPQRGVALASCNLAGRPRAIPPGGGRDGDVHDHRLFGMRPEPVLRPWKPREDRMGPSKEIRHRTSLPAPSPAPARRSRSVFSANTSRTRPGT